MEHHDKMTSAFFDRNKWARREWSRVQSVFVVVLITMKMMVVVGLVVFESILVVGRQFAHILLIIMNTREQQKVSYAFSKSADKYGTISTMYGNTC